MSECIVRMEMPECCMGCPMEYDGFMCSATLTRFYFKKDGRHLKSLIDPYKERLPNYPIVCVLPERHGRLIDTSTVLGAIRLEDLILKNNVPTIVPAKEEI